MPAGKRTTQHHCPQCFAIAKPRCFSRGHLVKCEVHNVCHSPYSECVQCKDAEKRAEREARAEKEAAAGGGGGGAAPPTTTTTTTKRKGSSAATTTTTTNNNSSSRKTEA
ncbi:hypothetical protein QBC44DRAFT_309586 [Cladorrhinum sp. PSN332]|nr:hypothetical protein QBC44DRAFT_309586 [Cladorrhinum sp. PSN332]